MEMTSTAEQHDISQEFDARPGERRGPLGLTEESLLSKIRANRWELWVDLDIHWGSPS